jgi:hypothetical protein
VNGGDVKQLAVHVRSGATRRPSIAASSAKAGLAQTGMPYDSQLQVRHDRGDRGSPEMSSFRSGLIGTEITSALIMSKDVARAKARIPALHRNETPNSQPAVRQALDAALQEQCIQPLANLRETETRPRQAGAHIRYVERRILWRAQ